jgi:hypothetical protein
MRRILPVPVQETLPPLAAVLEAQGIPRGVQPGERIVRLAREAIALYAGRARPVGTLREVNRTEFGAIFEGEGRNDGDSPVGPIFRAADSLALFAATVGDEICREISELFRREEFALAAMLDSAASEGAEATARVLEQSYRRQLEEAGRFGPSRGILRFSPGYCGWDLSAQRTLFESLQPESIDIHLNSSCLMRPLKSISGVLIAGRKEIFEFDDTFSFCSDCTTHECRDRIRSLRIL